MTKRSKANPEQACPTIFNVIGLARIPASSLAGLPHALSNTSSFLSRIDPEWTLESESKSELIWRLNILIKNEWPGLSQLFREKRFESAIKTAMLSSHFEVMEWWILHYHLPKYYGDPTVKAFKMAVELGCERALMWLKENRRLPTCKMEIQVSCRYPQIAYWIHENSGEMNLTMDLDMRSYKGDFDFVKWAHEHEKLYATTGLSCVMDCAVYNHNLNQMWWLHMNQSVQCSPGALERALKGGHFDLATLLYENHPRGYFRDPVCLCGEHETRQIKWIALKYEWNDVEARSRWVKNCLESGQYARETTELLFERHYKDGGEAMKYAVFRNDLDLVKWLDDHQAEATTDAMDIAARYGRWENFKWLHNNRTEGCTTKAMDKLARYNSIDQVQWLHANRTEGCTTRAMDKAAKYDNSFVVQWLHANRTEGCTTNAMDEAARDGNLIMVQWLHENRSEGCTTKAMDDAAAKGYLNILQFLHENRSEGCTTDAMDSAARGGHLHIVKFLHENRSEGCTTDAMDKAANIRHFKMVQYLHDHRHEGCTTKAMDAAAKWGFWQEVEWFGMNRPEGGTQQCVVNAGLCGCLEMVRFLTLHCKIYCDLDTLKAIYKKDRFDILEWLLKHYHDVNHVIDGNLFVGV